VFCDSRSQVESLATVLRELLLAEEFDRVPPIVDEAIEALKFVDCVPRELRTRMAAARFDPGEALESVGRQGVTVVQIE